MGGCVATARRHSLQGLPYLLVNTLTTTANNITDKLQFSSEIINEQNVQTVGMPTAPTISLISCRLSLINSCLAVSLPDNICISDVQYYELNARRNLWCEILEF